MQLVFFIFDAPTEHTVSETESDFVLMWKGGECVLGQEEPIAVITQTVSYLKL
jgi:hypothetical protein